ncbi:beta-xylosidase [Actinoplanes sp. NPDC051513]|uniref:beta-xylosidase n=1 Tax=Actinoplanes sp. NPDC051513 TaxID=3363908 RepID=UPI00379CC68B
MLKRLGRLLAVPVLIVLALVAQPAAPALAAVETLTVDMTAYGGTPTYRASGFIYGISQNGATPSSSLQSQIKVKVMRAGGSQIGCPNGGYVNGGYTPRWNFIKAYYARARATGAKFSLLLSGMWGSDGVCNVPRWPGDSGNWTEYTNFVNQLIADAKANGMTGSDVRWDMWNEPNIFFWGRTQSQYLEMIRRGTQLVRAAIPGAVIEGPSYAGVPTSSNSWWTTYLNYVKANNVVPNIISWHDLPGDPATDAANLSGMLSSRGITISGTSVNEYGAFGDEQQPGPSAWYISRLERCNCDGARANWGMVGQTPSLYDTFGWLVTANAGQPMGQWWVYKRYADQTGQRTKITASSSHDGIVFQDSSARKSIAVLGAKAGGAQGAIDVRYTGIPSWLPTNGSVNVLVERMPSTNAYVSAPTVVSNSRVTVSGGAITVPVNWANAKDAYAVTLTP